MKIILLIIFLSGSRAAFFDWKESFNAFMHYYQSLRRGFNPIDYFMPPKCNCGKCKQLTDEELLEKKVEVHHQMLKDIREQTIVKLMRTIFSTGIVIAAIYYYIILTLN